MTLPSRLGQPRLVTLVSHGLGAYLIPFKFVDPADIVVTHINRQGSDTRIPLVNGVDYSVTGGNFGTGTVNMLVNHGGPPDLVEISVVTSDAQPVDLTATEDMDAETLEKTLDRLTMIVQELRRDTLTPAQVESIIGKKLTSGAGIKINRDNNLWTIVNLYDAEFVRDTIGATVLAGSGMQITPNDEGDKIEIKCTVQGVDTLADVLLLSGDEQTGGIAPGGGASFAETVLDLVGNAIVGIGLNVDFDDNANAITITNPITAAAVGDLIVGSIGGAGGITATPGVGTVTLSLSSAPLNAENVRDIIGATIVPSTGVQVAVADGDETNGTVTLSSDRLAPDYKGLVPSVIAADFFFQPGHNGRAINRTGGIAYLDVNSSTPLPDGWATVIRNTGAGPLTITRIAGVELYKQGTNVNANATIAPGGMATIQRWDVDEFTITGPGVS